METQEEYRRKLDIIIKDLETNKQALQESVLVKTKEWNKINENLDDIRVIEKNHLDLHNEHIRILGLEYKKYEKELKESLSDKRKELGLKEKKLNVLNKKLDKRENLLIEKERQVTIDLEQIGILKKQSELDSKDIDDKIKDVDKAIINANSFYEKALIEKNQSQRLIESANKLNDKVNSHCKDLANEAEERLDKLYERKKELDKIELAQEERSIELNNQEEKNRSDMKSLIYAKKKLNLPNYVR